jgi:hypothetical protein
MIRSFLRILAPVALGLIGAIAPMTARSAEPAPKPETYLCPHATGGAVDCFLHAVEHLYTMCRQVKSIEIIEFGYEKSAEGTNGAKSEYCADKHRLSITRPYQSALREATPSRTGVDGLRAMYEFWLKALAELKWIPGESDAEYKARVAKPYSVFTERAGAVRAMLSASNDKAVAATGKGKAATTAAAPSRAKSAN